MILQPLDQNRPLSYALSKLTGSCDSSFGRSQTIHEMRTCGMGVSVPFHNFLRYGKAKYLKLVKYLGINSSLSNSNLTSCSH